MNWIAKLKLLMVLPVRVSSFYAPLSTKRLTSTTHITLDDNRFCSHPSRHLRHVQLSSTETETYPNGQNESYGLYVHIPFCRRRCNYCDFAIVPIGKESSSNTGFAKINQQYTDALLTELSMIAASTSSKILLRSIYFGGGTPSLAPLSTLEKIMHAIYKSDSSPFLLDEDAEVTIEMDPGTFDLDKLKAVKEMGFNRISLGVQSLDDTILQTLGRVHRSSDVYSSIDMIRQVYGEEGSNYSIDLISGVPGLTLAAWTETLYKATRLHPRPLHISLYDLQVEAGTAFGKWYDGGDTRDDAETSPAVSIQIKTSNHPALPSTEECAWQYKYASGYLRNKGYEHYEISSYAYNGQSSTVSHRSKHNQIYWEMSGQWYSIGLGSTSSLNCVRYARPRALSDYISWTRKLTKSSKPPWLLSTEQTSDKESERKLLDIVMTRLRTSDGLDLDQIAGQTQFKEAHVDSILRGFQLAIDLDLGTINTSGDHKYGLMRLKDPNGFLFSNNIISNIFMELDLESD